MSVVFVHHLTQCPVTGLPIYSPPEWQDLNFGFPNSRMTYAKIGSHVLYAMHRGDVTSHLVSRHLEFVTRFIAEHVPPEERIILLEDCFFIKELPWSAIRTYVKAYRQFSSVQQLVFISPYAWKSRIFQKFGQMLFPSFEINRAESYQQAIHDLIPRYPDWFGHQKAGIYPDIAQRQLKTPNLEMVHQLLSPNIIRCQLSGTITVDEVDKITVFMDSVLKDFKISERQDYFLILDMEAFQGLHYAARKYYLSTRQTRIQRAGLRMVVYYNVKSPRVKTLIRISAPFLPFSIRTAPDQEAALALVAAHHGQPSQPGKAVVDPLTATVPALPELHPDEAEFIRKSTTDLLTFISDIAGEQPAPPRFFEEQDPFYEVYQGLLMLKSDYDQMFHAKLSSESVASDLNYLNGIRAEIWKMVAEGELNSDAMIQTVLNLIGPAFGLSRAAFLVSLSGQPRDTVFIPRFEWLKENTPSISGLEIPSQLAHYFPVEQAALLESDPLRDMLKHLAEKQPELNLLCLPTSSTFVVPLWARNRYIGIFLFLKDVDREPWPNAHIPVLSELAQIVSRHIDHELRRQDLRDTQIHLEDQIRERISVIALKNEELRRVRMNAEIATKAKSDFLARVSHDLRTPLTVILGLSDMIMQSNSFEFQQKQVSFILSECLRMRDLINQLLDLTKIEAGKMEINLTEFVFQDFLIAQVAPFKVSAEQKGLFLKYFIQPGIPHIIQSEQRLLGQIIGNILSNAVKFTSFGGVTLTVESKKNAAGAILLYVEIQDTGIGIAPEKLPTIFEPYEQGSANIASVHGGTGLGTTIVRQLVTLLAGDLGVTSTLNKGTRFWFSIPITIPVAGSAQTDSQSTQPETPKTTFADYSGRKILVAEDYPGTQLLIRQMLELYGCDVAVVSDGQEAVNYLSLQPVDMVLMDLKMPNLDGFAATAVIRQMPERNRIPIVAMSANAFQKDQEYTRVIGMNGFLEKPLERIQLESCLMQFLGGNS